MVTATDRKQWTVQVFVTEDGDATSVRAVLITRGGGRVDGLGHAHHDPSAPEVGDKAAMARALADLATKLSAISRSIETEPTTAHLLTAAS
ncbi:dsRBD fold-containing protein [Nonomuraea sp. NPDC049419]|uniref:dsRBD fold-containing protein n=1 Tax=Nonomuraea sp. NPDC049419 TaxID=3155772 RepID=UPI00343B1AEF